MDENELLKDLDAQIEKGLGIIRLYGGSKVDQLEARQFLTTSRQIINCCSESAPYHLNMTEEILNSASNRRYWIESIEIEQITGILKSLKESIERGFLKKLEYSYFALSYDNFLDHADNLIKDQKEREAGILASVVFEDTLKKVAEKNGINKNQKLTKITSELEKKGIFKPIKTKRFNSRIDTRNKAIHIKWDEFDIDDVKDMIAGCRELIENHLE